MSIQGNWDRRRVSRRDFLVAGGLSAAALALSSKEALAKPGYGGRQVGFGGLIEDKNGLLDLPEGFRYRVISPQFDPKTLEQQADGVYTGEPTRLSYPNAPVPGDHDGMAAFPGPRGTTILVRNHELSPGDVGSDGNDRPVPNSSPSSRGYKIYEYDPNEPGGTTGIIVDRSGREVKDYVTSAGTNRNCSGGPTPWNTWLTCEETRDQDGITHGYVFEVNPYDPANELSATPIKQMGFFSHEAVAVDPRTGIVYLTEDDFRGEIPEDPTSEVPDNDNNPNNEVDYDLASRSSFLYRFVPDGKPSKPGDLLKMGGKLEALGVEEAPAARNMDLPEQGAKFRVVWIPVDPETAHDDALNKGAARFNRLEGADFAGGAFWFDDTAGGEERLGQVWRLIPGGELEREDERGDDRGRGRRRGRRRREGAFERDRDILELFFEAESANNMESPDNLVIAPWGDVWFCEDGDGTDRVMGITPEGRVYEFAHNRLNDSELAGCTFAPDGKTFFVNIQNPGLTFMIWGPFARVNRRRQRKMAHAAPPAGFGPKISGELAEAAEKYGMSPWEAAAFDRLGLALS